MEPLCALHKDRQGCSFLKRKSNLGCAQSLRHKKGSKNGGQRGFLCIFGACRVVRFKVGLPWLVPIGQKRICCKKWHFFDLSFSFIRNYPGVAYTLWLEGVRTASESSSEAVSGFGVQFSPFLKRGLALVILQFLQIIANWGKKCPCKRGTALFASKKCSFLSLQSWFFFAKNQLCRDTFYF